MQNFKRQLDTYSCSSKTPIVHRCIYVYMRIGDTALLGDYESNGAGLTNERWIVKESMHAKQFKGEFVVEFVNYSARRKIQTKTQSLRTNKTCA